MTKKVIRYNSDVYSIFDDERFVGSVLKLTSGLWKAVDENEERMSQIPLLQKPKDVLNWI